MYLVYHDFEEFSFSDDFSFLISAINDEYNCISAGIVGRPNAPNPFLTSKIPSTQFDIFMTNLFNIATDRRSRLNRFA